MKKNIGNIDMDSLAEALKPPPMFRFQIGQVQPPLIATPDDPHPEQSSPVWVLAEIDENGDIVEYIGQSNTKQELGMWADVLYAYIEKTRRKVLNINRVN